MNPSFNHSYIQIALGAALFNLKKYSVHAELSIEIAGKEYIPDISVYPKQKVSPTHDIIKMTEVPLLAIEILSLSQIIQELIDKIEIYLNAGVQSYWLIAPVPRSITVFNDIEKPMTFGDKMVDEQLNISLSLVSLSLDEIFPF